MARITGFILIVLFLGLSGSVYAAVDSSKKNEASEVKGGNNDRDVEKEKVAGKTQEKVWSEIGVFFPIAIAAAFGTIGMGIVGAAAVKGVARNPGSKPGVQGVMILAMVFIESLAIYSLIISLMFYTKL
ncbi:MAG: ATP synthase F0 subunit C [Deltaproteobacteria bacterium]|nr:ATP synthase F0 subunit C [Deltaproteobacteria bacterium]